MTCREFKHEAASLMLRQLCRSGGQALFAHAEECPPCAAWLDEQQMLATEMQRLQAKTAGREAGPDVERALLRMFRQEPFKMTPPVVALRSTPVALGLRRFFAMGAFAGAAAAIVIGLFVGFHLMGRQPTTAKVQGEKIPSTAAAQPTEPVTAANSVNGPVERQSDTRAERRISARAIPRNKSVGQPPETTATPNGDDQGYVSLMFCDPEICSSDVQVVRMEVPVAGMDGHDGGTQVADVVVGYDGLVRAMRIEN